MSCCPWDPPAWMLGAGIIPGCHSCSCPPNSLVPDGGGHLSIHPSCLTGVCRPDIPPTHPGPRNTGAFSKMPLLQRGPGPHTLPRGRLSASSGQFGSLDAPSTHLSVCLSVHLTPGFYLCPGGPMVLLDPRPLLGLLVTNHLYFRKFFFLF